MNVFERLLGLLWDPHGTRHLSQSKRLSRTTIKVEDNLRIRTHAIEQIRRTQSLVQRG